MAVVALVVFALGAAEAERLMSVLVLVVGSASGDWPVVAREEGSKE